MTTKGDQTSTSTTSASLPAYIQPSVTDFLNKASTAANLPYTANPNQQVAPTSAATTAANQQITNLANAGTPTGITNAQTTLQGFSGYQPTGAMSTLQGLAGYQPTSAMNTLQGISGYKPTSVLDADLGAYMDPYAQQSIDVQKQQATLDYNQQQNARDASAVQAGAFGGSRQAVANSIAQQNLNTNLQGIEATGLNTAYNNATQLFQNDQSNQLQANQLDLNAANDQGNLGLQSAQLGVSAASAEGNLGLQSAQLGINAANDEGNLAGTANTLALNNAAALSGVGAQQQTQAQNVLNAQNAAWTAQNQYPVTQADLYSKLLNGTYQPQTTTSTTSPPPSLLSQLAGAATAAVGVAKLQ